MATINAWNNQVLNANILFNGGTFTVGSDNAANAIVIGSGTTARTIDIGFSAANHTITIGVQGGSATLNLYSGTGNTSVLSLGSFTVGASNGVSIDSGAAAVNIATGANAQPLNLGTGAATKAVTLGSATAGSTTTIQAPSAGVILTGVQGVAVANKNYVTINTATGAIGSDAGPSLSISITGDTGGALTGSSFTFTGGTTGLSFGGSGSTETLTFVGITANGGTVSLATDATASTINIGTGGGAKTTTLGSTNTTSTTTIQSGSGNIIHNIGLTVDSSGRMTNTAQPIFSANNTNAQNNATGDGTAYTLLFNNITINQGTGYVAGTGIFTAPKAGNYFFTTNSQSSGVVAQTSGFMSLVATSQTIIGNVINATAVQAGGGVGLQVSGIIPMALNDTCKAVVTYGGSTKTVNFGANSSFSGYLIC